MVLKANDRVEPVCFKKQQKKVPNQLLVCGILNGIKLILDDHVNHLDSYKSVWNHSGLSEVPYSANQSLVRNCF